MPPVLVKIGPVVLRWYGAMMGLALFLSIPVTARFAERFGIARTLIVDSLAFPFLTAVLIGARLGYVVSHPQEFVGDPLAIVRPPYAGLASHGAIALGLAFLFWWCPRHRVPLWRLLDAAIPAFLLAVILVRWGNFMNGELYGDPTRLPWGVVFPSVPGGPRHPLPLYEMVGTAAILAWTLAAARRPVPFEGYLFWSAMTASSVLRFLLDLLRSEDRTVAFLTWGQMAALVLIGWGVSFLWAHSRAAWGAKAGARSG